jgi:hypothetical protein
MRQHQCSISLERRITAIVTRFVYGRFAKDSARASGSNQDRVSIANGKRNRFLNELCA